VIRFKHLSGGSDDGTETDNDELDALKTAAKWLATPEIDLKSAKDALRTIADLFGRQTSSMSSFEMLDAANQLNTNTQNSEDLKNWFNDLNAYARGYVARVSFVGLVEYEYNFLCSSHVSNRVSFSHHNATMRRTACIALQDIGRQFFHDKYRAHRALALRCYP